MLPLSKVKPVKIVGKARAPPQYMNGPPIFIIGKREQEHCGPVQCTVCIS